MQEIPGGGIPAGLIADSAVNRNRRPVFIPDFARQGWMLEILPALRISHLGKFIAPRFARRYTDAFTLCALLRPQRAADDESFKNLANSPLISDVAFFFDCAVTIGEPIPSFSEGTLLIRAESSPLAGSSGEPLAVEADIPVDFLMADQLISRASAYCTLKSGDLILPGSINITFPVSLDRSLTATINGLPILSTRIK